MIVLIGTNEKKIKTGSISHVNCPNCKSLNSFDYNIYSIYTSLTLVPLFPVDKRVEIICSSCKVLIDKNDLSDQDLNKFATGNENLRNPIVLYSGIIIGIIAILYFLVGYFEISKKNNNYFKHPKINDIYVIKDSKGYYSALEIVKLEKESIFFLKNKYQFYSIPESDEISEKNDFDTELIFSKNYIDNLNKENSIKLIIRN
jgi:hypothetical protein